MVDYSSFVCGEVNIGPLPRPRHRILSLIVVPQAVSDLHDSTPFIPHIRTASPSFVSVVEDCPHLPTFILCYIS